VLVCVGILVDGLIDGRRIGANGRRAIRIDSTVQS
jgi:hypothetical protein